MEHILPQQALRNDPADVTSNLRTNDRSGLTFLFNTPLYVKGQKLTSLGCSSWKGRFNDKFLKETLHRDKAECIHVGHHLALQYAAYLGAFRAFGYAFALTQAGSLLRRQFFSPRQWLKDMPIDYQIVLMGQPATALNEELREYWSDPFKFAMEDGILIVVVRSFGLHLPISRDPTAPVVRHLPYAPSQHKLKPDLKSMFD